LAFEWRFAERADVMPYLIGVVLIVAWFAAVTASYTMGGFIHVVLAVAIVMFLIRIFSDPWSYEARNPR
jgi:hypothetical protein